MLVDQVEDACEHLTGQRGLGYLSSLRKRGLSKAPSLEPEVRRELLHIYREDILKLQDLIQRDLSAWLEE